MRSSAQRARPRQVRGALIYKGPDATRQSLHTLRLTWAALVAALFISASRCPLARASQGRRLLCDPNVGAPPNGRESGRRCIPKDHLTSSVTMGERWLPAPAIMNATLRCWNHIPAQSYRPFLSHYSRRYPIRRLHQDQRRCPSQSEPRCELSHRCLQVDSEKGQRTE